MKTIVVTLDKEHPDGEAILRAGEIIKAGGLVAFPTETVYGLGGDALNPESSRKIYAAKGRPSDNPLIVHICRWEDIYKIADPVPEIAQRLGFRSPNAAEEHLKALARKGAIEIVSGASRGIRLLTEEEQGLPLIGRATCRPGVASSMRVSWRERAEWSSSCTPMGRSWGTPAEKIHHSSATNSSDITNAIPNPITFTARPWFSSHGCPLLAPA